MAMKSFRKDMFLTTLIIVVFIFFIGFYVGYKLDTYRVDDADAILRQSELDSESFLIEQEFINVFASTDCKLINSRIQAMSENLGELGRTLARYDAKKMFRGAAYDALKQRYFLLEMKTYTMKYQLQEVCGEDTVTTILFFYDVSNNEGSLKQGYALDALVDDLPNDVTIFSFDREYNDSALETLEEYYEVESSPTIILDFDDVRRTYVSVGELKAYIREKKEAVTFTQKDP